MQPEKEARRWADIVDSDDDNDNNDDNDYNDNDTNDNNNNITFPTVTLSDLDFSFLLRPGTIVINPKSNLRSICPIKCL